MLLTIDFETYYDGEYSLSKFTTEEYVRSRLFEVICVSVKVGTGKPQRFTGTMKETWEFLRQFDWEHSAVCSHNAMFDMSILQWHFQMRPHFILDTVAMGRGLYGLATSCSLEKLGEFLGCTVKKGSYVVQAKGKRREEFTPHEMQLYMEYCSDDTELCFEILQKLHAKTQPKELRLIDWTTRAFTEPTLRLNPAILAAEHARYQANQATLLSSCGVADVTELRSDHKLAALLEQLGAPVPMKTSPATGAQTFAFAKTDEEFMELLDDDDPRVVTLVEARLGTKTSLVGNRIERFIGISRRGPLPVPLMYAGASATKRWSGTDQINLQNLPRNPKGGFSPLRQAIEPPPGYKLGVIDLSQIELRINCWQAGQMDVLQLLASGGDSYSDMASTIYGIQIDKAMGKSTHTGERFVGKTAVLGCGYGCGGPKFQFMLKVAQRREGIKLPDTSLKFAEDVKSKYRSKNKDIVAFWERANLAIPHLAAGTRFELGPYDISNGCVWLPNGTFLHFPNLRQVQGEKGMEWAYDRIRQGRKQQQKIYGAKLVENVTQAVARIVMSDAMLRILDRYWIVGTVHDELMFLVPENDDHAAAMQFVTWAMTVPPAWAPHIPLACEGSIANNYAEAK